MTEYSHIEFHRFSNALGMTERIEHKWVGKSPVMIISWRDMALTPHSTYLDKKGNKICVIGPYRLRIIGSASDGNYEAVRMDYPFWWIYPFLHHVNKLSDLFYRRVIITCAVWGLAEYSGNRIPSYEDLYIYKFVRNVYGKRL